MKNFQAKVEFWIWRMVLYHCAYFYDLTPVYFNQNWVDYYFSDYNDAELQKVYLVASRDIIFPPQSASIPIKYNQLYVQNLHLSFCIQEYLLLWKNKCGKLYQLKRRNALNLNSKIYQRSQSAFICICEYNITYTTNLKR